MAAPLTTNSSAVLIPPPGSSPATATNDIRDIRPARPIPSDYAWVGWLVGAAALLALAIWAWRWWRKRRLTPAPVPAVPPHIRARQKLNAALAQIHDPRVFCFQISEALRLYLEERFNFRAPERTTEEFLVELQASSRLLPDQKQSLTEFLERCDLVKFARFEPTEVALRELHDRALRLVEETQYDPVASVGASTLGSAGTPPPVPAGTAERS